MRRNGVQENQGGISKERPSSHTDDNHDNQGQNRVKIVLILPIREPYDTGADHDDNTAKSISHDMQENT